MEDQKDVIEGISTQALELLLREQIGDETATITDFRLTFMPHNGFGGQNLIQAKVFWTGMGGSTSADWVVKQWRPGGPTRILLNISLPLEALSWKHGLIRPEVLPAGIIVPIVGVILDEVDSSAWIVMEDIASELAVFSSVKSPKDRFEQTSFMLDKLASWHVAWEHPKRQAALMAHPWLIQQETRLWSGADLYADCLGQEPRHPEQVPDKPLARRRVKIFLNWLSEPDRVIWEKHLPDREVLVKACSNLPQTLLHGDLDPRNIGLRWRNVDPHLLLIDWEWIGVGSPALDVRHAIESGIAIDATDDDSQQLADFYFDRYLAHGGKLMDRPTWERAYNLALIFYGLRMFSIEAGASIDDNIDSPPIDRETIRYRTDQITQAMRKWLF